MKKIGCLCLSIFFYLFTHCQTNKTGIPFITNYYTQQYNAAEQNWSIVQDNRGILYFGNNDNAILEYDGVNWRKIQNSNGYIVRCLAIDSNSVVYLGALMILAN